MALVSKGALSAHKLATEAVPCAPLGGDVLVRALSLSERLQLRERMRQAANPYAFVPLLLAVAVLGAGAEGEGEQPLATPEEWEAFGHQHPDVVLALFDVAYRLAGLSSEDNRKN